MKSYSIITIFLPCLSLFVSLLFCSYLIFSVYLVIKELLLMILWYKNYVKFVTALIHLRTDTSVAKHFKLCLSMYLLLSWNKQNILSLLCIYSSAPVFYSCQFIEAKYVTKYTFSNVRLRYEVNFDSVYWLFKSSVFFHLKMIVMVGPRNVLLVK